MSKNTNPKVFLAHNSRDKSQIRVIADKLNQKGIDTWLDEEQIPPGVSFQDRIQKAIAEIDCAIIFIGKQGLGKWQGWELEAFFSKLVQSSIPLIPVLLPGVKKIPDDLLFLQQLNWVQFTDNLEDSNVINKLVWGITGKVAYTDYSKLETLLASGQWREANTETRIIILQSANRRKEGYLLEEKIRNFDPEILLTLDRLWLKYSNNRFGFSIQKNILIDCHQEVDRFGIKVGWQLSDDWINENSVIYNSSAPVGHLPYAMLDTFEINNAAFETLLDITKTVVTQNWQKEFMTDAAGFVNFLSGNKKFNVREFRKQMEVELSHSEGWWKTQRLEEKKIKNLCSLLFSCKELTPFDRKIQ